MGEQPSEPIDKKLAPPPQVDEAQQRMEQQRAKLDKFKEKVLAKFQGYIMGLAVTPPEKEGDRKGKTNILVLIDDEDSMKMTKDELHDKLTKAIDVVAKGVDKEFFIDILLVTELWQSCYDAKYDLLQLIALSAPIYDTGVLGAVKITEIHKSMTLKKFEKYIACYVLAGSLVRGKATLKSDIDVFVVIDDTDVKKMTRVELKDKLRAIINDMAVQAGQMTGIQNKLSIQVYILTDFWDNIKEANPIIFTFLRDGIPFYDRGVFMPWKQLLKMGKIRPSSEAIDLYKATGDQMIERAKNTFKAIAIDDMWYATITPSQAAIMLYGHPPPAPRETPNVMRDLFVKKEKLFDEKHIKFMEQVIKVHKDFEYGQRKSIKGDEVQDMVEKAEAFLKALGKLYTKIEERKEEESVVHIYENTVTLIRDVLKLEGIEKVADEDSVKYFEKEVVNKGVIPERYLRILKEVHKAKKDYDRGKLTKAEVAEIRKNSRELVKFLVEHVQRVRAKEFESHRIRIKHGEKLGEVVLLEKEAFITMDIDAPERQIIRATLNKNGSFKSTKDATLEEYEKVLAKDMPRAAPISAPLLGSLESFFGKRMEILLR
ncbi:MAG: nucleotidyltransferase domain-containing protein [Candidatus Woesearchaeota archaeon]|nr:nucleotidyltransferase domain-containing protein [Candidatus Woesearchaeota archaeon]